MRWMKSQRRAGGRGRKRSLSWAAGRARKRVWGLTALRNVTVWGERGWSWGVAGKERSAPRRALERDLSQALSRQKFSVNRAFRALSKMALSLGDELAGREGMETLKSLVIAMLDQPGYAGADKGQLTRSQRRIQRQGANRVGGPGRKTRLPARQPTTALWGMAERMGFPMEAVDELGEGFERWALFGARNGVTARRRAALLWWRDSGRGPDREGAGAKSLAEAAVAMGATSMLSALERVWPKECSAEATGAALGEALSLVDARARARASLAGPRLPEWGLTQLLGRPTKSTLIGAMARMIPFKEQARAIALAARHLEQWRPEAVSPRGGLSERLLEIGDRALAVKMRALERAALAREERRELEGSTMAAPPARANGGGRSL